MLSEAKHPGICKIKQMSRSFLRYAQDLLRLLRMTGSGVFLQIVRLAQSHWPSETYTETTATSADFLSTSVVRRL